MYWLMPANGKLYDHANAFKKWGFIDWRQNNRKYAVNDIVYIYCTRPYQKIMYKTVIEKINIKADDIINDFEFWIDKNEYYKGLPGVFVRLKLVNQVDTENLSLKNLINNGLSSAPQSSIKLANSNLITYIDKYMDDYYYQNVFPESANTNDCIEGAKTKIYVNKYERSSIARKKCIEYYGCKCSICKLDFEEKYGEIGKDFIHVHHLVPLNEIGEEYCVDYKNDLIPVCPNCHAMLHRELNGKFLSVDELKKIVN